MFDKTVQSLISKFARTPSLVRRVSPANSQHLIPPLSSTDTILNGLNTLVFTYKKKSFNSIEQIIQNAGGNVCPNNTMINAVVCDVRDLRTPDKLSFLLNTDLQQSISKLSRNGRVVIIGDDHHSLMSSASSSCLTKDHSLSAATQGGILGFMKSLSKELAQKGITTNLLLTPPSSQTPSLPNNDIVIRRNDLLLTGPLNFFLSNRSAFITGQKLSLSIPSNSKYVTQSSSSSSSSSSTTISTTEEEEEEEESMFSLKRKRVILTGASRGIGACTAKLFHAEGAELVLLDHPIMEQRLKKLSKQLNNCDYLCLDITNNDACDQIKLFLENKAYERKQQSELKINKTKKLDDDDDDDGHIDVVIHNAGITRDKSYKKMTMDQFQNVLDVNLLSIIKLDDMLISNHFLKKNNKSRIIYLSSISGIGGAFGQTNYSCSKSGIISYVKAMGLKYHGIGVNAIAPGFIETEMTNQIPFMTRNIGRYINALQQGGYPIDVAEAILFLSSEASTGVNGNTLRVCGHHLIGA